MQEHYKLFPKPAHAELIFTYALREWRIKTSIANTSTKHAI